MGMDIGYCESVGGLCFNGFVSEFPCGYNVLEDCMDGGYYLIIGADMYCIDVVVVLLIFGNG